MTTKTDLCPSADACAVDYINARDGGDAALPKAEFIKSKLIPHGGLVELTAPFGGGITP
jgi:hypothetical protein